MRFAVVKNSFKSVHAFQTECLVSVFKERGKSEKNSRRKTSLSKGENHSHMTSTTGFKARATLPAGECSHHYATLASSVVFFNGALFTFSVDVYEK